MFYARCTYSVIFLSILLLTACENGENEDTVSFDRQEMLNDLATGVIIPAYEQADQDLAALDIAVENFVATPNATTLAAARDAFLPAYKSFQQVAFMEWGPAFNVLLKTSFNTYPADFISIENNISSGTYNLDQLSSRDQKGFPAVDYLLYGAAADDTELISLYTSDSQADTRKMYLTDVLDDMVVRLNQVVDDWKPDGGNYLATFVANDGTDVGSSLGMLVNDMNQYIERDLRDAKVGIPLGRRSQGIPIPGNVEARYSQESIALLLESLAGMLRFYRGDYGSFNGKGLYEYLVATGARYNGGLLADAINDQFEQAIISAQAIPPPLEEAVVDDPAPVNSTADDLQKIVVLCKVDLPSALGVLITYQDNDGD